MKTLIVSVLCILTLFPLISHAEYRAMHGVIISTMDGVAHVLTEDGNVWEIDKEDFSEDDRVFIVLDDMNTPEDVTDDIIRVNWYDPMKED